MPFLPSPWLSVAISCLALIASGITLWLSFFNKGQLLMTQPTSVFFGPDGPAFTGKNKVHLRALLCCTAKRGRVLESLHVALQRNESKQNFNIWVYGEKGDLHRGSGIFVPQDGVTFEHHFLLPADGANFQFLAGAYKLVVFAKIFGERVPHELTTINLSISEAQATSLSEPNTGIFFDWGPDQQSYHPHIDKRVEVDSKLQKLAQLVAQQQ